MLSIDWDLERQEYIVKQPSISLLSQRKVLELRIHPRNFVQIKDDELCVYMDALSGQKFATVGNGTWYNEGVLYFLFSNFNPKTNY